MKTKVKNALESAIAFVLGAVLGVLLIFFVDLIFSFGLCKIEPPLAIQDVSEESQTDPFRPAIMSFTHEEAESLLNRFEEEKRIEAERKRAEEQRRAALIQTGIYSASYFRRTGRIRWGGWDWTYYSERILPGYGLRIPGRHTDSLGYVRDENGYLCLASDALSRGTVIETPFGSYGRVYDCGPENNYTVDVYVGW